MARINDLVANNKIDEAISMLRQNAPSDMVNDLINLHARWNNYKKNVRMGLLIGGEESRTRNQIVYALLSFAEDAGEPSYSNSSSQRRSTGSNNVSGTISQLKELQKKVRFGFSVDLKKDLASLLDSFLSYQDQANRDELYDYDERKIEALRAKYNTFSDNYSRELRTKNAGKVAEIKQQLRKLETDFTMDNAGKLTEMLTGFDVRYAYLGNAFKQVTALSLENFAMQLADVVDSL